MSIQIKLKNTVVQDRTPGDSALPEVGELALNANINSIGGFMRASDNSIVKIFGPGSVTTPTATTTVSGIAELATSTETTTGSATNRVVTPAGLNAVTVAERTTSNNNYVAKAGSTMTGVLTATAGSNSAPSINFGDSDSGIFGGTNTVSLAAGGTTRLTADTGVSVVGTLAVTGAITSTSDLTIPDKIIHSGDTNTAIRFPAADTVSIETGGSERARVDSSGRLLVGTSTAQTSRIDANTFDPLLQVTSNIEAAASITRFSNTTDPSRFSLQKSRGTIASPVIVQDNDVLGEVLFSGWDGDTFTNGAKIIAAVDGTPGDDDMPSRLVFSTTADGAASSTTRLTIDSAGLVKLPDNGKFVAGSNDDLQLYHNATDSFLQNYVGNLKVAANSLLLTNRDTDETYISCTDNDAVKLYFNNNLKFQTTDTGVSVTGAITTTGGITLNNSGPRITFTDSNEDPDFYIEVNATQFLIQDATNNAQRFRIQNNGIVDINGNTNFGAGIDVIGDITATGNLTISSNKPTIVLTEGDANPDYQIFSQGGVFKIKDSTNAADRLVVDSSGKVGIGTSSPATLLNLNVDTEANLGSGSEGIRLTSGSSNAQLVRLGSSYSNNSVTGPGTLLFSSNKLSLRCDGGNPMTFHTGSTVAERMRIDSSGRLLLGTTTEGVANASKFTIADTGHCGMTIRSGTSHDGQIAFSDGTSGNDEFRGQIRYNHGSNYLTFVTDATERVRIDSSGRFMVGVTSSSVPFQVAAGASGFGGENTTGVFSDTTFPTTGVGGGVTFSGRYNSGSSQVGFAALRGRKENSTVDGSDYAGALTFATRPNGGNMTERMRIDSSGNVGIGTTSPQRILHSSAGSSDNCILATSAASNAYIGFADSGTTNQTGLSVRMGSSGDSLIFQTGGTNTRMLIDSSGRLLVGHSSGNGFPLLSVSGNTAGASGAGMLFLRRGLDRASIGSNVGADLGEVDFGDLDGNIYASIQGKTDAATGSNDFPGRLIFATTADGGSSPSERMRIDSSGNVGIGLTAIAGRVHAHSAANTATFIADGEVDNPQYPSYGFAGQNADNGDRGAGMYLPGDNTLAFSTQGDERVRIGADGTTSIGRNTSEGSQLMVDNQGQSRNTIRISQAHSSALAQFTEVSNTSYVGDGYKYHGSRSAGSNYNFMAFDSAHASTPDREFTIRGDGNAFADGTWNNNGADYAEFFESSTGSAIPVGTAVVLENNKVRAATSSDAVGNIIGVVRPKEPGQASMTIGNTAWNKWQGKYLTDDFDRFILDEHNVINWTEADGTFHSYESHAIPSDVTVPSDAQTLTEDVNGNKFTHYRLNPDYDSSKTYVPRSDRDEWIIVGLVGQVKVLKGQAVNDRWVKMKDVSDTVEEYFIR